MTYGARCRRWRSSPAPLRLSAEAGFRKICLDRYMGKGVSSSFMDEPLCLRSFFGVWENASESMKELLAAGIERASRLRAQWPVLHGKKVGPWQFNSFKGRTTIKQTEDWISVRHEDESAEILFADIDGEVLVLSACCPADTFSFPQLYEARKVLQEFLETRRGAR